MSGMQDKLSAPPDFDGPVRNRRCTDIIFLILIVCMWIAMTAVGIASIREGDVEKLLAPTDYDGNLCGWDTGYEDLPNLYYVNTEGSGICVESCPNETDTSVVLCRYDRNEDTSDLDAIAQGYCLYQYESTSVLNYCVFADCYQSEGADESEESSLAVVNYCVFTDSSTWSDVTQSNLESNLSKFLADVYTARGYVFGFGFGIAMLVAFLYIGLLQIPFLVSFLVWSCVLLILVALVALAIGLWVTADDWDDEDTKDDVVVNATRVVSVIAMVLAVLWFCLFCFLAKRISLAIGVIKEAGRAIARMPLIAVWPVLQLAGSIAFMAVWTTYAVFTASLGEITTKTATSDSGLDISYKVYDFDDDTVKYRAWFLIFCLFWSLNFITAMGQIVIAMSISSWYFARNKNTVGSLTVVSSVGRTFIFHIGTAAFGGLIVAIVEMIQAVLSYIQKKAKGTGNKPLQYIACCCACCFWCLEKCIRFVNKNAYVQTAIFSTNFCTSARKAFFLIARNIARVAAVSILGGFVLTIMTLFVTAVTTVCVYYAMDSNIRSDLNSIAYPTILTAVLAYYTGKMITSVYGMAITTILQCFVADEELFPPSQQFAENDLKSWVDRHGTSVQAHSSPPPTRQSAQSYAVS